MQSIGGCDCQWDVIGVLSAIKAKEVGDGDPQIPMLCHDGEDRVAEAFQPYA